MHTRYIIIAVIAALLIIFILQNSGVTDIRFLFWTISISKLVLAIVCFLLGFVFASYFWLKAAEKGQDKKGS
jgi:putative membrane protein